MTKRSIFFDEWQACLRAHYIHVIRTNDAVTERTLRTVLQQSGLTGADLQRLVDEAFALGPADPDDEIRMEQDITAADELPAELDVLVGDEELGDETALPDELPPDDEPEPIPMDEAPTDEGTEGTDDEPPPPEPDQPPSPQQLTLF